MKTVSQLSLFVYNDTKLPLERINRITETIYRQEKIKTGRITNLICCSDYTIKKLNRLYRNIDRTTDVLSFPFAENDLLGEIYISLHRTEVQARRYKVTFDDEFVRLFVHGMFHLAGYDHIKENDRKIMEALELRLLDRY